MKNPYTFTFAERIEECEADIRILSNLVEYYRTIGDTQRACNLERDIEERREDIRAIREEQRAYNHNLGYSLF